MRGQKVTGLSGLSQQSGNIILFGPGTWD